jgi:ubiquinone/menaquinone biosynthesis C-methylase UbiE
VHATWLLRDGHRVHLVDVTPGHVERAEAALAGLGLTAQVGDARCLAVPDASFDAVLVLGPLYHLVERADRLAALGEARRVVKPGGLVAVAAISRYASLIDGLVREFLFEPEFRRIVRRDLADGRHVNPDNRPHWFTTGWLPHLDARWRRDADRKTILEATRLIEAEPTLLGLSAHLLAVALRAGE